LVRAGYFAVEPKSTTNDDPAAGLTTRVKTIANTAGTLRAGQPANIEFGSDLE
jgi:hypothetical protein